MTGAPRAHPPDYPALPVEDAALVALGGHIPAPPGSSIWIPASRDPFGATRTFAPHASEAGAARALLCGILHSEWRQARLALALDILDALGRAPAAGDHDDDILARRIQEILDGMSDAEVLALLASLSGIAGEWTIERHQVQP